ncbi:PqiC family protein [Frateuria defendens]|uniref:PqiC family protein n=1 Tax=Frateuria defendens TaxID=2219559 RepID=UPI00066FC4B6|nr:PqiC family protein [Frateuria defendens]
MIHPRHLLAGALALGLAACASAPMHYYTLVPPASDAAALAAPFQFELLPVTVPAQVDQPQLVVREGGQGVAVLDGERWIAPLPDEVRGALSADLAHRLGAQDASGLPLGERPRLRIKVDLRRFDSQPGSYALVEAVWSLRTLPGGAVLTCTSRLRQPVGAGYAALVAGHQQALAALAGAIAAAAPAVVAGQRPACPAG